MQGQQAFLTCAARKFVCRESAEFLIMPEYRVVSAHLEKDRQVIIDLWRRNLADTNFLEEKYDWHFLNNPFGPGQIWILKADGHPIGTTSLGMRRLKLGDCITTAGVACDLAVNKDHRFLQPALMLQRALLSSANPGVQILYGVPNPGGASVMKYVGYRQFCSVDRYAKVLRPSHYLLRSPKLKVMAPFIGSIVDQGFLALQSFGRRKDNRVAQVLPGFDERFDELWNGLRCAASALTVRNRCFLKWRYRECPLRQYKILGLLTPDDSKLLGYLIYYVEDASAICVDLLAPGSPEDLNCLLSSWSALALAEGLASLSISCPSGSLANALMSQGFSRRSLAPEIKSGRTPGHEPSKTLFTHLRLSGTEPAVADSWYYTEGDSPY
jgi:hypothetical protein